MKNPADKNKPKSKNIDKYTATEVGALVEQFQGEFRVFGERQEAIGKKLDATYEQVARNTEDIAVLKVAAKDTADKLKAMDARISFLEAAINNLADKIEKLTKSIDELVKTKASHEELQSLEKRVSAIELKLTSIAG